MSEEVSPPKIVYLQYKEVNVRYELASLVFDPYHKPTLADCEPCRAPYCKRAKVCIKELKVENKRLINSSKGAIN